MAERSTSFNANTPSTRMQDNSDQNKARNQSEVTVIGDTVNKTTCGQGKDHDTPISSLKQMVSTSHQRPQTDVLGTNETIIEPLQSTHQPSDEI